MKDLIPSFQKSIFTPLAEVGEDLLEIGLDTVLQGGVLKELPIVGSVIGLTKFSFAIRERNLLRQTLAFMQGLNDGSASQEAISKHREKLQNDPKLAEKELGRVILILESHIESVQSRIAGRLYNDYMAHNLSWDDFCELSEANRRMFISDYHAFLSVNNTDVDHASHRMERLVSLGLITHASVPTTLGSIDLSNKNYKISALGKLFLPYIPTESFRKAARRSSSG